MKVISKILLSFSTLWLIASQSSFACDCIYAGEFKEFAKGQTVVKGIVESLGSKLEHDEGLHATMKVSIRELIKGSYPYKSVNFMGDPGYMCLLYIDSKEYPIGSEHLFILFSQDKEQGLAGCGEVSVSISSGKIHGTKLAGKRFVNYSVNNDRFIKNIEN